MHCYTIHLTNGLYMPSYQIDKDSEDEWLALLGEYLLTFIEVKSTR